MKEKNSVKKGWENHNTKQRDWWDKCLLRNTRKSPYYKTFAKVYLYFVFI